MEQTKPVVKTTQDTIDSLVRRLQALESQKNELQIQLMKARDEVRKIEINTNAVEGSLLTVRGILQELSAVEEKAAK